MERAITTNEGLIRLLSSTIGMQDFYSSIHLCSLLMQCSDVPGDVVEFGCSRGDTAKLLTSITTKPVVVYDSFEGLPEPTSADAGRIEGYRVGALGAFVESLIENFEKDGLPVPKIVKGWFNQISQSEVPEHIAFAHIDADFFESTIDALMLVYPNLSKGACCVIHDYGWEGLPGVKRAVDEFLFNKPEKAMLLPATPGVISKQAYFRKL